MCVQVEQPCVALSRRFENRPVGEALEHLVYQADMEVDLRSDVSSRTSLRLSRTIVCTA